MEMIDIEGLLKENGIIEKVIFYGIEEIATGNPIWRCSQPSKAQTPNFVQFNKLPASQAAGGGDAGGDVVFICKYLMKKVSDSDNAFFVNMLQLCLDNIMSIRLQSIHAIFR